MTAKVNEFNTVFLLVSVCDKAVLLAQAAIPSVASAMFPVEAAVVSVFF